MKTYSGAMVLGAILFAAPISVNAQGTDSQKSPSTVDGSSDVKGRKEMPGAVGAMNNAASDRAMSADDARRQTEGRPTAAQAGAKGNDDAGTKPGITQSSPGTVGAAPGKQ